MRDAIILGSRNFSRASVPRAPLAVSAIFSQVIFPYRVPSAAQGCCGLCSRARATQSYGWAILLGRRGLRRKTYYSKEAESRRNEAAIARCCLG